MARRGRAGARLAGLALLCVLAPGPARAEGEQPAPPAGAGCGPEVSAQVQARYDGIRSLRARFTQTTRNVAFGGDSGPESVPASGRVEFAKPGRMRFEYETPEPSLVVSDGKTLWIYDPTAREVQVLPVSEGFLSAAAIQFLLGEGRLDQSFEVTATSCGPERAELALRPRAEASYERIDLVVERGSGWIRETTVHDLLGNRTQVAFMDMETAGAPDDARFRFDVPEGVKVLTLEEKGR
jgi:outer membrane lipoprotein carrier protein